MDDISLLNLDEGTDDPRQARAQLYEAARRANAYTFIYGSGMADKAAEIVAANTAGKPVIIIGTIHVATAVTLYVPIVDTLSQIFTWTSAITIDNMGTVRPEWFGIVEGCIPRAVSALPSTGGLIRLVRRRYPPSGYHYGFGADLGSVMDKQGVKIYGAQVPNFTADLRGLENGSIIEGAFYAFADGFEIRDVGIDHGIDVVEAYYGEGATPAAGVHEGLLLSYANATQAAAGSIRRGAKLHNVRAVAHSPTAPVHGMILAEGYQEVVASGVIEAAMGIHGVVIKGSYVHADSISAYCNAENGVIIKSDASYSASAKAFNVDIGAISTWAAAPPTFTPYAVPGKVGAGLRFDAAASVDSAIDIVQIGSMMDEGHSEGISYDGPGTISNVQITRTATDGNDYGMHTTCDNVLRSNFGDVISRNCQAVALLESVNGSSTNRFGSIMGSFADVVLDCVDTSPVVGSVIGESTSVALMRLRGTARPRIGMVEDRNSITALYASDYGVVPQLGSGWSQFVGTGVSPFYVVHGGQGILLSGLLKAAGGASTTAITLPVWARPLSTKRFWARGLTAANVVENVELTVFVDGTVVVNEQVGGVTNCQGWLSIDGISYPLT